MTGDSFLALQTAIADVIARACADPNDGIAWAAERDVHMLTASQIIDDFLDPEVDAAEKRGTAKALPTDGTDSLIGRIIDHLHGKDVTLRGHEWRATAESDSADSRALILRQWTDAGERDQPTGPQVRVTFTAHVEDVTL